MFLTIDECYKLYTINIGIKQNSNHTVLHAVYAVYVLGTDCIGILSNIIFDILNNFIIGMY